LTELTDLGMAAQEESSTANGERYDDPENPALSTILLGI
jgi:hypothetical protein